MTNNNKERPLVTFALFAYNQEKYIREAVEAALAQTYDPLEIILSDDCSQDRTFEIMQELVDKVEGVRSVRLRRNKRNVGLVGHINIVIEESRGEFISIAAGDDVAMPDRTEKLMQPFMRNSRISCTHSGLLEIDADGNKLQRRTHSSEVVNITVQDTIKSGRGIVTQSCCFKKSAFAQFGPLSKTLTHEAAPIAIRCALTGNIEYINEPLTNYRVGSGVSTRPANSLRDRFFKDPVKISGWRSSSYQQIVKDLVVAGKTDDFFLAASKKAEYWSDLHALNTGLAVLWPMIGRLRSSTFDLRVWKAFARFFLAKALRD